MATGFSVLAICAVLAVTAQAVPLNTADAQSCAELCASCQGIATFVGDKCECNIEGNTSEGAECVTRMRRQAEERGLNLLSCDLSSDKRSTRCTLGLKHKLGRNHIDQVAKYFMQDGPMTGNIFRAPPITGKSSDCVGAARIVTQPAETYELRPIQPQYIAIPRGYMDMDSQPIVSSPVQQFVSSPQSDCVGAQRQQMVSSSAPTQYSAPEQDVPSRPTEPLISSPTPKQNAASRPKEPLVSSPKQSSSPKQLSIPQHTVSSPSKEHKLSSPKSDDSVGAPHQIITQPKETMPKAKEEPKVSSPQTPASDCGPSVGQAAPGAGAVNPLNILGVPSITPTVLQMLGKQFSQPMLGIPQAIHTISNTPGISDLVSVPGHLLNGIIHRLGVPAEQAFRSSSDEPKSSEDTVGMSNTDTPKSADDCASNLGSENPASTISYLNPGYGTQFISLLSPTVGAPWNPTVGASTPGQMSYMNPTVGAPAPTHISYVHQLPAYTTIPMIPNTMMSSYVHHMPGTYIVGSPLTMPFYNNISPPMSMKESDTTLEETFKYEPDQHVGSPKGNTKLKQQKKICKKSTTDEEAAKKTTRDVKGVSESMTDEEIERQSKMIEAAYQQEQTTELPKIDRTTTSKPTIEKLSVQKTKVERSAVKADKVKSEMIGKIKPAKEITKKSRGDKKSIDKRSVIKS